MLMSSPSICRWQVSYKELRAGKELKLGKPITHGLYHTLTHHWSLMPSGADTGR